MLYFLDTNICIDFLRGASIELQTRLKSLRPSTIKIPSIVQAELPLGGKRSKTPKESLVAIERFLDPFEIAPFCDRAADHHARIRFNLEKAGRKIGPNDLIIAATVIANHGTLVSHNTGEFRRVAGLKVEDWTI